MNPLSPEQRGKGDSSMDTVAFPLCPPLPAILGETIRPEIWNDATGDIDGCVSGVDITGSMLTGIFRCIKQTKGRQVRFAAVEPGESPPITRKLAGQALKRGRREKSPHPFHPSIPRSPRNKKITFCYPPVGCTKSLPCAIGTVVALRRCQVRQRSVTMMDAQR
jgi:hypothetical protein